jgi:hypothetical protein
MIKVVNRKGREGEQVEEVKRKLEDELSAQHPSCTTRSGRGVRPVPSAGQPIMQDRTSGVLGDSPFQALCPQKAESSAALIGSTHEAIHAVGTLSLAIKRT